MADVYLPALRFVIIISQVPCLAIELATFPQSMHLDCHSMFQLQSHGVKDLESDPNTLTMCAITVARSPKKNQTVNRSIVALERVRRYVRLPVPLSPTEPMQ